jgi:wyosine [tRNA(Phe)-imidazoG37] synthetase (radical SAM superfamily)
MNHASKPAAAPAARYVFGPVPSRRLERSLGVDLMPLKTRSYDCIYCQLGRTNQEEVRLIAVGKPEPEPQQKVGPTAS